MRSALRLMLLVATTAALAGCYVYDPGYGPGHPGPGPAGAYIPGHFGPNGFWIPGHYR
jgi:hypothetical protein